MATVLILTALLPRWGSAQRIRGTVVDSVSQSPVPSGFVVLLDAQNAEAGRSLADRDGNFFLVAPGPGAYRLRSERIGFRPVTSPAFTLVADSTLDYRLVVSALPVRLRNLNVAVTSGCQPLAGQPAALAVWDEARKALAAVAWGQRGTLDFEVALRDRVLSPTREVWSESVRRLAGPGTKPFTTKSPAELGKRGYIDKAKDGSLDFYGPDAETLSSSEFLSQHCFRTVTALADSGLVGLAFDPLPARKNPDISGTIWVDDSNAELRFLEFSYVHHGIEGVTTQAGGRIEFEALPDGYWIVRRWHIRIPHMVNRRAEGTGKFELQVGSYVENAGELITASEGQEVLASPLAPGAIRAKVTGDDGRPVAGAEVRITGTNHLAVSDPDGRVVFPGLPEGVYLMEYTHPVLPSLGPMGVPDVSVPIISGRDTTITVAIPSVASLLDRLCPGRQEHAGALAGRVTKPETMIANNGFPIRIRFWNQKVVPGESPQGRKGSEVREVQSSRQGYYLFCNLPSEREMLVSVLTGYGEQMVTAFVVAPDSIHQRDLMVDAVSATLLKP